MKTRFLLAAVCILILPICFSPSKGEKLMGSTPFATVAIAGHTIYGNWCECGTTGCICEPGEGTGVKSARPITDASTVQPNPEPTAGRVSEPDFGAGALLIAFALFMWTRLRS